MSGGDRYAIHGLVLAVRCEQSSAREAIRRRLLPYLESPPPLLDEPPVEVIIERAGPIVGSSDRGRCVYESSIADVTYDETTDRLVVDASDSAQMVAALTDGSVHMSVLRDDAEAWALCAHPLLTLSVLELMKRRGRFPLHAGGVAVRGGAVLLPGSSGAGKTTLTAALLQAGADLLSDDIVFLDPSPTHTDALSFADELDVTDDTAAMFPELADLVGAPLSPGRPKHQVRAEDRFGRARVHRAPVLAIVLPAVVDAPSSAVGPADPADLLALLAPNVLLTDPLSSQHHIDALAGLLDRVPTFHLAMGRDPVAAAQAVLSVVTG